MKDHSVSAVLFVKDLSKLATFYEQIEGMSRLNGDDVHVVLEIDNFRLVVHKIPEHIACDIAISDPPFVREENPINLSFRVNSIADARKRASELGGQLYGADKEWHWDGCVVSEDYDPEGNRVSVWPCTVSIF